MTIIDRLLRACATGVGCRATINMKALRTIDDTAKRLLDPLSNVERSSASIAYGAQPTAAGDTCEEAETLTGN